MAREPGAQQATDLLNRDDLVAPSLLAVEVTSALARKVQAGEMSREQAREGLDLIFARIEFQQPTLELATATIALSLELKHSVYDCTYLALAEAIGGQLATHDDQLSGRIRRSGRGQLLLPLVTV